MYKISEELIKNAILAIKSSAHPKFPFEQLEALVNALASLEKIEEKKK